MQIENLDVINESSTFELSITFTDEDDISETPSSLSYKITDYLTGTVIRDLTSLTPAETVVVRITPDDTRILNSTNENDIRSVAFVAQFGSWQMTEEYCFVVRNLNAINNADFT